MINFKPPPKQVTTTKKTPTTHKQKNPKELKHNAILGGHLTWYGWKANNAALQVYDNLCIPH